MLVSFVRCSCYPYYEGDDCGRCVNDSQTVPRCLPCPNCAHGDCVQPQGTSGKMFSLLTWHKNKLASLIIFTLRYCYCQSSLCSKYSNLHFSLNFEICYLVSYRGLTNFVIISHSASGYLRVLYYQRPILSNDKMSLPSFKMAIAQYFYLGIILSALHS